MTSLKAKSSLELVFGARVLLLLDVAWLAPAASFEFDDFNFKLICKNRQITNFYLLINLSTTLVEKIVYLLQFPEFYSHFIRWQSVKMLKTVTLLSFDKFFFTYLICTFAVFKNFNTYFEFGNVRALWFSKSIMLKLFLQITCLRQIDKIFWHLQSW